MVPEQYHKIYDQYRMYINMCISLFAVMLLYYNIIQYILINIYMMCSLLSQSIDTIKENNMDEYKLLLQKWICYAHYIIFEWITFYLFYIMPFSAFYNIIKLLTFLWIIQSNENVSIWYSFIISLFDMANIKHYISIADNYVENGYEKAKSIVKIALRKMLSYYYSHNE